MKKIIQFIKQVVSSHSGISSKRVCGVLGWFTTIGVLIYCSVYGKQAPEMVDTFMVCCMTLLGIDSITGIWKSFDNKKGETK